MAVADTQLPCHNSPWRVNLAMPRRTGDCMLLIMKALKSKMLGTELAHAYTMYSIISAFYADDHLPIVLTLVGNGRQLNLPHGNKMAAFCRAKVKNKLYM